MPPADHTPFLPPSTGFAPPTAAPAPVAPPASIGGGDAWQQWAGGAALGGPNVPSHAAVPYQAAPAAPAAPWTEVRLDGFTPVSTAPPARRRSARRVGALVATAALVAGGLASVRLFRGNPAGSATPEQAVERLVHALERRDFLGAVETLPAYDRELIADGISGARRLNAAAGQPDKVTDAYLHDVPGYTLSITGLETTTEAVNDHISEVTLSGGRFSASLDLSSIWKQTGLNLPTIGTDGVQVNPSVSGDLAALGTPVRLATVRDGEGWHVSFWYTIAELARQEAGLPAPDPANRIAASGADAPEAAARGLADALLASDVRQAIALLPDGEGDVLHDYGSMLVERAPKPATKATITAFETHTKGSGNRMQVVLDRLAMSDDNGESFDLRRQGSGCLQMTSVSADGDGPSTVHGCIGDVYDKLATMKQFSKAFAGNTAAMTKAVVPLFDDAGFVTVRRDGKWFVSPIRSTLSLSIGAAGLAVTMLGDSMFGGDGDSDSGNSIFGQDAATDSGDDTAGAVQGDGSIPLTVRTLPPSPASAPEARAAEAVVLDALGAAQLVIVDRGGVAGLDSDALHATGAAAFDGSPADTAVAPQSRAVSWAADANLDRFALATVGDNGICYVLAGGEYGSRVVYGRYDTGGGQQCHATGQPTTWGSTPAEGWDADAPTVGAEPWPAIAPLGTA